MTDPCRGCGHQKDAHGKTGPAPDVNLAARILVAVIDTLSRYGTDCGWCGCGRYRRERDRRTRRWNRKNATRGTGG
jgi:hypothetical protein